MTEAAATEEEEAYGSAKRFYETLLKTEWAAPNDLAVYQEDLVRDILGHAVLNVPYHRDRLGFLLAKDGSVDLRRWLEVPTMTRRDLEANYEDLVADDVPAAHGGILSSRTSASSGNPVLIKKTRLHNTALACASLRHALGFNMDWSKKMVLIRAMSEGARRPVNAMARPTRWGPNWIDPSRRGERVSASIHTPLADQIQLLRENGPCYVNTSPTNAMALTAHIARTGEEAPEIAAILTIGEYVPDDLRKECRTYLNCDVVDVFSTGECGVIACQCPDSGHYHMQPELTVLEVLKPDGRPCRPGETGRVTATPLYNYAMPLVRYQTEDYVTVGEPCTCGRTSPVLSKILGRDNHHFVLKDGRRLRPEPAAEEMRRHIGFRRWQLVQTAPEQAELRIMDGKNDGAADYAAAAVYIESLLDREIKVSTKNVAALGPTSGGKFASILCAYS